MDNSLDALQQSDLFQTNVYMQFVRKQISLFLLLHFEICHILSLSNTECYQRNLLCNITLPQ